MKFDLRDSVSVPGNPAKPNEDRFGITDNFSFVIDGATGLGDKPLLSSAQKSDAAWLAETAKNFWLKEFLPDADIGEAFYRCALHLRQEFNRFALAPLPQNAWEYPSAVMVMARLAQGKVWIHSLGDCTALIVKKDGEIVGLEGDPVLASIDGKNCALAYERVTPGMSFEERRAQVISELRADRAALNTPQSYGALSATASDPRGHIRSLSVAADEVASVLLASDGFYALVEDYRHYDASQLLEAANRKGLAALADEVRAIESADSDGARYPRFKKSDDASALLLGLIS